MERGKLKINYCNKTLIRMHLAEAIMFSKLPMMPNFNEDEFTNEIYDLATEFTKKVGKEAEVLKDAKTVKLLGSAHIGSGHDCFLKGVTVNAVITAPSYWYPQMQRYHFIDIVSSQSKMHRITKMDLISQCSPEVKPEIIDILNNTIDSYNNAEDKKIKEELFRVIVNNCPMGLNLTCGITTNYLQLKSMYHQRKCHKLAEWSQDFVNWVLSLPAFSTLIGVSEDDI